VWRCNAVRYRNLSPFPTSLTEFIGKTSVGYRCRFCPNRAEHGTLIYSKYDQIDDVKRDGLETRYTPPFQAVSQARNIDENQARKDMGRKGMTERDKRKEGGGPSSDPFSTHQAGLARRDPPRY